VRDFFTDAYITVDVRWGVEVKGFAIFCEMLAAMRADRIVLDEISLFAQKNVPFAFETTLSGRTHLRLIQRLKEKGYRAHFFFLWVDGLEVTLSRIRERVIKGGHDVPERWSAADLSALSGTSFFIIADWLIPGTCSTIPAQDRV
jgi:hypothetical protein